MSGWVKSGDAFRVQARTAVKVRLAPCCGGVIRPGERYLMHVELPGGEAGYADSAGHPVQMAECARCATRDGRGELLGDAQDARAVIERALDDWADYGLITPAQLAEHLSSVLDGAR
ncbi:MAG TPA: hypothetical protein VIP06_02860 [Nocardioides sp.]